MPATTADTGRVSYIAEYYDPQAALTRTYQLFYCESDSTVELHDLKNKRIFLRRCPIQNLTAKEVFLGATVTVYGRQLHLVDYGDAYTKNLMSTTEEEAFARVTAISRLGNILSAINDRGLRFSNILLSRRSGPQPVFHLSAVGKGAESALQGLQQQYSELSVVASDPAMFRQVARNQTPSNTTLCVVKPHAILSGDAGAIVQRIIDEGFEIVSFAAVNLGQCDAEDFLEVYKTVVPEYTKLVEHMASGPCWAIEVRAENSVDAFRAVCGPHDPEVCRVLFPTSIRAQYGHDRVKNAVHCTDLPEESVLEVEFFFTLLPSKPR